MKKNLLSIGLLVLLTGTAIFTGCKKDDVTAPEITLSGNSSMDINLGDTYSEPGATATDRDGKDKSSDVSSSIVIAGSVDNTKVGTYTITYNVSDGDGNKATEVRRTVRVKSDKLAGSYSVSDVVTNAVPASGNGTYAYTATVTQSSVDYNKIFIANFGGFGAAVSVYATVEGATITIPLQAATGASPSTSVSGTGTYNGAAFKITNITYTATNAVFGNGNAAYTKL